MCLGTDKEIADFNEVKAKIIDSINDRSRLTTHLNNAIGMNINLSQMAREVGEELDLNDADVAGQFLSALEQEVAASYVHTSSEQAIHA